VHSGYVKRRRPLLEAGVALYELKRMSAIPEKSRRGPFVRSASSLHAKTFSVDRSRVFIGSFNFDPRSAKLNTELGFVIESRALAETVEGAFDRRVPADAYEVHLTEKGNLYWIERRDGESLRHDTEPGTSARKRAAIRFLSLLPIEWLL
jgi:putative cardiolipin synthase